MDQHLETIGAFMDGERVDTQILKAALATEEGRAYLVELAALREVMAAPADTVPASRKAQSHPWRVFAAAGVFAAALGVAGFAFGRISGAETSQTGQAEAPQPTKVMKLENGVNWNETRSKAGGN